MLDSFINAVVQFLVQPPIATRRRYRASAKVLAYIARLAVCRDHERLWRRERRPTDRPTNPNFLLCALLSSPHQVNVTTEKLHDIIRPEREEGKKEGRKEGKTGCVANGSFSRGLASHAHANLGGYLLHTVCTTSISSGVQHCIANSIP